MIYNYIPMLAFHINTQLYDDICIWRNMMRLGNVYYYWCSPRLSDVAANNHWPMTSHHLPIKISYNFTLLKVKGEESLPYATSAQRREMWRIKSFLWVVAFTWLSSLSIPRRVLFSWRIISFGLQQVETDYLFLKAKALSVLGSKLMMIMVHKYFQPELHFKYW